MPLLRAAVFGFVGKGKPIDRSVRRDEAMTTETNDTLGADDPNIEAALNMSRAVRRLHRCDDMLVEAAAKADSGDPTAAEELAKAARQAELARWYTEGAELWIKREKPWKDLGEVRRCIKHVESVARDALEAIGKCRSGDAARLAKEASGVITETTTHLAFLMDELPVKP